MASCRLHPLHGGFSLPWRVRVRGSGFARLEYKYCNRHMTYLTTVLLPHPEVNTHDQTMNIEMSLSIDDLKVLQEKLFDVSNKWYIIGLQ